MEGMVSLKMTDEERKRDYGVPMEVGEGPEYPYGTRLTVEGDRVEQLGLASADIGQKAVIMGVAEVVGMHKNDTKSGKDFRVEIQITELGVKLEQKSDAEVLFPDFSKE